MTILIVDDDPALLDALAMAFEDADFQVRCVSDGQRALDAHAHEPAQLIISDVNMPFLDGYSVCRALRGAGDSVPIILLTSRDNEIDEALGLELGADDYVAKPFSTRVLIARVKALLRRATQNSNAPADLQSVGQLSLDPERMAVTFAGQPVKVTVTEFRLLQTLTRRPGVVWSRTKLMDTIRGDDSVVAARIIDTYVRRLRRKFESIDPSFTDIETVVGAGYRWRG